MFPSSVDTALELLDARNNRNVTLTAPINDSVTTIPVADTSLIPTAGYVTAEDGSNEVIHYTGVTPSSLTGCTRGADGTTASSHGNGGTLGMWGNAAYHNLLAQQLIAVEQNISDRIGLHASQVILQANLNANSFKLTGLAAGSGAGDSVRYEQVLLLAGGTMTGAILLADGAVGTPSLSFGTDTDTGIYRPGANQIAITAGGVAKFAVDSAGGLVAAAGYIQNSNGSAAAPAYSFSSDPNTGIYSRNPDQIGFSTNGTNWAYLGSTGTLVFLQNGDGDAIDIQGATAGTMNIRISPNGATSNAARIRGTQNGTDTDLSFLTSATVRVTVKANGTTLFTGGSVSLPGISFLTDTDTGLFLGGANFLSVSCGGTEVASFAGTGAGAAFLPGVNNTYALGSTALGWTQLFMMGGSAASPAYTFRNDPNTGIYNIGADSIGFATNGVLRVTIDNSGLTVNSGTLAGTFTFADGSAAAPSVTFGADLDTGMYRVAGDIIGFSAGGTRRFVISGSGAIGIQNDTGQIFNTDGTVGAPSYSFINDTDLGIYRIGTNQLAVSAGGTFYFSVAAGQVNVENGARFFTPDGTLAAPAWSFGSDQNTGIYRSGADQMDLVTGASLRIRCESGANGVSILGCANNSDAAAGFVGEEVVSTVSSFANLAASNAFGDLAFIVLTAGDWDVEVSIEFFNNGATWTAIDWGTSDTNGNSATNLTRGLNRFQGAWASSSTTPLQVQGSFVVRVSTTGTTNRYLKVKATYSAGTPQAIGTIRARRIR